MRSATMVRRGRSGPLRNGHPAYRIRQLLPGRIRFYIPSLQGEDYRVDHFEMVYREIPGVTFVRGSAVSGTLLVIYQPARVRLGAILMALYRMNGNSPISPYGTMRVASGAARHDAGVSHSIRRQFAGVLAAGAILGFLVFQRFLTRWFPFLGRLPVPFLASGTAILAGIPVVREGLSDMIEHKQLSLDFLVSVAAVIAIVMGQGLVALEVIWLMNCGTLLEHYTEERSRRAIRKLLEVGGEQAWLLREGTTVRVPLEEVQPGDVVIVHGGEKILVDGEVVSGQAAVNQAPITGESIPVEKNVGDTTFAGTLVDRGTLFIQAEKVGDATYLARVLHMVEESLEHRAPIESVADRFAAWFVPSAFLVSLLVFAVTRNFYRAFTVLVTACPCAASIATPTAISAAVGNAAKRKMLVKGGIFIEQASRIDTLCLDKTGTLTEGKPRVVTVLPRDRYTPDELVALAASAESRSFHPLAHALLEDAKQRGLALMDTAHFESEAGSGIEAALVDGRRLLVGSHRLMGKHNVSVNGIDGEADRMRASGETLLYVAVDGRFAGLIGVVDRPRPEAQEVIRQIQESGIRVYLLTGDHRKTAEAISHRLGIEHYYYDMLPEDKAHWVEKLRGEGKIIAMVGDGVNDALALANSDLGIAMGAGGSDVAVEAADIALPSSDLTRIPALRDLSRRTVAIIYQNYVFSIGMNSLGIGLGAIGWISPFMGGVLHVFNSLGVILNSGRILLIRDRSVGGMESAIAKNLVSSQ